MKFDDHPMSAFCHRPKNICSLRNVGVLMSFETETLHPDMVNYCPNCGAELKQKPPEE